MPGWFALSFALMPIAACAAAIACGLPIDGRLGRLGLRARASSKAAPNKLPILALAILEIDTLILLSPLMLGAITGVRPRPDKQEL